MNGHAPENFEKPYLLLCEGKGDKLFFDKLFERRQIGDEFSVHYPIRPGSGRSEFGRFLSSASTNESFISNVKSILIASENDSNEEVSFAEVRREIEKSNEFPIPNAAQVVARSGSKPSVVVLMIPIRQLGNLESLCLQAAYAKWGLQADLDQFVKVTPAAGWPLGKQAKMKMQTILAATNSNQPDTGFGAHWNQPDLFRVPLDHQCFDGIVNFLQGFAGLVS
jgi:hypothetical protein